MLSKVQKLMKKKYIVLYLIYCFTFYVINTRERDSEFCFCCLFFDGTVMYWVCFSLCFSSHVNRRSVPNSSEVDGHTSRRSLIDQLVHAASNSLICSICQDIFNVGKKKKKTILCFLFFLAHVFEGPSDQSCVFAFFLSHLHLPSNAANQSLSSVQIVVGN